MKLCEIPLSANTENKNSEKERKEKIIKRTARHTKNPWGEWKTKKGTKVYNVGV